MVGAPGGSGWWAGRAASAMFGRGATRWPLLALLTLAACAAPENGPDSPSTRAMGGARVSAGTNARPINNVVGMSERQVTDTLGTPSFRRTDGPNELVQYRTADCILDVFFYPNANGELTAAYVEARNGALATVDAAACAGQVASLRGR